MGRGGTPKQDGPRLALSAAVSPDGAPVKPVATWSASMALDLAGAGSGDEGTLGRVLPVPGSPAPQAAMHAIHYAVMGGMQQKWQ